MIAMFRNRLFKFVSGKFGWEFGRFQSILFALAAITIILRARSIPDRIVSVLELDPDSWFTIDNLHAELELRFGTVQRAAVAP